MFKGNLTQGSALPAELITYLSNNFNYAFRPSFRQQVSARLPLEFCSHYLLSRCGPFRSTYSPSASWVTVMSTKSSRENHKLLRQGTTRHPVFLFYLNFSFLLRTTAFLNLRICWCPWQGNFCHFIQITCKQREGKLTKYLVAELELEPRLQSVTALKMRSCPLHRKQSLLHIHTTWAGQKIHSSAEWNPTGGHLAEDKESREWRRGIHSYPPSQGKEAGDGLQGRGSHWKSRIRPYTHCLRFT